MSSFAAPVTLVESLKARPCLVSTRWKVFATSRSMPGMMRSRNSTTVTSAPRRRQTLPSSRPITPPPTTTRWPGTSSSSSAPVEVTMRSSSTSTPGSGTLSLPVAMTIRLASYNVPPTSTLPAATMRPAPLSQAILFLLNRNSTPLTLAVTTSLLRSCMRSRSSFTPSTTMPWSFHECMVSWKFSLDCSSAFEGMQPMLRQVPPRVARFSTTATFMPSCAARIAHT